MKRLLIVSPTFPPHPSPATHRARFLARYARECGWRVRVVTVDPRHYEEPLDLEILRLLPDDLDVVHVSALDPRWTRRLGVSDVALRSYVSLRAEVRRQCLTNRPDLIFIPGGPFYTFRIGPDARDRFGVPYVLDYTDPWVYPPSDVERSVFRKAFWSHRLATWLEPRVARNAAHLLAVSERTHDGMRLAYPEIPDDRYSAVPFGFEESDFEALRRHPRPNRFWERGDGNVHVVYVGVMPPNGFETLRAIFSAVRSLREREPTEFGRLRLHFIGTTYDPHATRGAVLPVATEMGLADIVREYPRRVPYMEALNVLTAADVVLGIGSTDHHYTASKIFPCILADRPLVAVYHEASSVCDIVRRTNAGALVTYDDVARAERRAAAIADALRRAVRGEPLARGRRSLEAMRQYSARSMCEHVFGVFDRVLGEAPARGSYDDRPREVAHG